MSTLSGKNRAKTAELCHALADETRLNILDRLKEGERCVCELTDALETGLGIDLLEDVGVLDRRDEEAGHAAAAQAATHEQGECHEEQVSHTMSHPR